MLKVVTYQSQVTEVHRQGLDLCLHPRALRSVICVTRLPPVPSSSAIKPDIESCIRENELVGGLSGCSTLQKDELESKSYDRREGDTHDVVAQTSLTLSVGYKRALIDRRTMSFALIRNIPFVAR